MNSFQVRVEPVQVQVGTLLTPEAFLWQFGLCHPAPAPIRVSFTASTMARVAPGAGGGFRCRFTLRRFAADNFLAEHPSLAHDWAAARLRRATNAARCQPLKLMNQRVILVDERLLGQQPRSPPTCRPPPGPVAGQPRPCGGICASRSPTAATSAALLHAKEVFDKDYAFLPRQSAQLRGDHPGAWLFAAHGVTKIRLTGGEPLLRRTSSAWWPGAGHPRHGGHLTTNGSLLPQGRGPQGGGAEPVVTVSLIPSTTPSSTAMNDMDFPVSDVLAGIDACWPPPASPGQDQHGGQARHERPRNRPPWPATSAAAAILRFIEFMDVGGSQRLADGRAVIPRPRSSGASANCPSPRGHRPRRHRGEVAGERWRAGGWRRRDRRDLVGHPGLLLHLQPAPACPPRPAVPCLFAQSGTTCRACCATIAATPNSAAIGSIWQQRGDRYSEIRTAAHRAAARRKIEMSYIGG